MAPDLVSVAKWATRNDRTPWLYTGKQYPEAILKQFVVTWLHSLGGTAVPERYLYHLLPDILAARASRRRSAPTSTAAPGSSSTRSQLTRGPS